MAHSDWVVCEDCNGVGCDYCRYTGSLIKPPRALQPIRPDAAQAASSFERQAGHLQTNIDNVRRELDRAWQQLLPAMRACLCRGEEPFCKHCHGYGVTLAAGAALDHDTAALYLRLKLVRLQSEHQRLAGQRAILRDLMPTQLPDVHPDNCRGLGGAKYVGD